MNDLSTARPLTATGSEAQPRGIRGLLEQYTRLARDTREKGLLFERLIAQFLRTDPLYSARFDAVCLLQPTSPFRPPSLIVDATELLVRTGATSVVTIRPTPAELHPDWAYDLGPDSSLHLHNGELEPIRRRQDLPPAFHRDGAVYVTRADVIRAGSLYGTDGRGLVATGPSVNIDTLEDFAAAERVAVELAR